MKISFTKPMRALVLFGASILSATLFVSCSSPVNLPNTTQPISQSTLLKGEAAAMKTLKTNRKIEHVSESDFNEKVLQSDVPVLVDFYAEWCGPCKALSPVLEEVARETPNAKIVKVNVDENYELANRYKIESIPSLLVFRDSRLAARHSGFADKSSLKELVSR